MIKKRYDKAGPAVAEAMKKRGFEAYYVSTAEEAREKALEFIHENSVVSWGGSMTIDEIGSGNLLFCARLFWCLSQDSNFRYFFPSSAVYVATRPALHSSESQEATFFSVGTLKGNRSEAIIFGFPWYRPKSSAFTIRR